MINEDINFVRDNIDNVALMSYSEKSLYIAGIIDDDVDTLRKVIKNQIGSGKFLIYLLNFQPEIQDKLIVRFIELYETDTQNPQLSYIFKKLCKLEIITDDLVRNSHIDLKTEYMEYMVD